MAISEKEIGDLETYFTKAKLPTKIQLDGGTNIEDVPKFVASHMTIIRNNKDKPIYEVFYQRLLRLKEILE